MSDDIFVINLMGFFLGQELTEHKWQGVKLNECTKVDVACCKSWELKYASFKNTILYWKVPRVIHPP